MPAQKDLKRLVRARMRKTGESYTAARAQLLMTRLPAKAKPVEPPKKVGPVDLAALAGMSDAAVKKATGCDWAKWVKSLDYHGAAALSHREIASLIRAKYKTSSWWSQMIAVGYERVRGLREKGQRSSGSYTATKSKTFPVAVDALFAAFQRPRLARWLDGAKPSVGKATAPKSVRMRWDDGTRVEVNFFAKGPGKSQAQLQHDGHPSKIAADMRRAWWTERFVALADELG